MRSKVPLHPDGFSATRLHIAGHRLFLRDHLKVSRLFLVVELQAFFDGIKLEIPKSISMAESGFATFEDESGSKHKLEVQVYSTFGFHRNYILRLDGDVIAEGNLVPRNLGSALLSYLTLILILPLTLIMASYSF